MKVLDWFFLVIVLVMAIYVDVQIWKRLDHGDAFFASCLFLAALVSLFIELLDEHE